MNEEQPSGVPSIDGVEWRSLPGLTNYPEVVAAMEARAAAIAAGTAREAIWLLEHPPLYTAGTSAGVGELLAPGRFPVFPSGRGGRYTYHGPGQRVGYLMIDLGRRGRDVRRFVHSVESWLIAALGELGVEARAVPDRIGIWVDGPRGEAKIGAIGVRVRRWVSFHGFALNVAPDLDHFSGIVPCGLADFPVTSLTDLGVNHGQESLDSALFAQLPAFLSALGESGRNLAAPAA